MAEGKPKESAADDDGGHGPRFACDAMLGGLARWLRAAGYDASWHDGIADRDLVRLAREERRTLLSSDDDLFAFSLVRDGVLPALFVPRGRPVQEQLAFVLRTLRLPLRPGRCMACGRPLKELAKEAVADRVPPRSLAAHDRFWECTRCRRVYWHGTHWERIEARLRQAAKQEADGGGSIS